MGEVEEEAARLVALDEVDRPVGVALREVGLHERILGAVIALDQMDGAHVVRVGNPEVFVEAALGRQPCGFGVTEVPFADHAGRVAGALEELGEGDFGFRQVEIVFGTALAVGGWVFRHAAAERIAARHQRRARGSAIRRGAIELGETCTRRGETVNVGGLESWMAVTAEITVTEIVGKDDDDVGSVSGGRGV